MKNKARIKVFLYLIFGVIGWSNCIGQNTTLKDSISKENRQLIHTMFDSIAYESLDLVMRDRAFVNKPDAIPELRKVTLDSIPLKLQKFGRTDKNIDSLYNYTERFIKLRNRYLESNFKSLNQLKDSLEKIVGTSLIIKSIIKDKDKEKHYVDLINKIEKHIEHTISNFKNIENKLERDVPEHLPNKVLEKEYNSEVWSLLNTNAILFFIVMIVSILLNIYLLFLHFKNKREKKRKDKVSSNNFSIAQKKDEVLRPIIVETLIQKEYEKWVSEIKQKFNTDCVSSISDTIENFKTNLVKEATSISFSNKEELQKYVDRYIETDVTELIQILKKCTNKTQAEHKIRQAIDNQSFFLEYSSATITKEEIHTIVDRFTRNLINELPSTISDADLSNTIYNTKQNIQQAIDKIIKDNLIFYFPFANDKGELLDDKKSKIKKRDSALRLVIDSHNPSKAYFQLLYDYSDMMQAGIQSYDIFLLPICDLTSENFNRTGSEIQQIGKDGQMYLEGNRWKIVKKITIKII